MNRSGVQRPGAALALFVLTLVFGLSSPGMAEESNSRIDRALRNITTLSRPEQVGYATVWDGNKYVQCRRTVERDLRCEAAGIAMQPSLRMVLTPERLSRLAGEGWARDDDFGNHVRIFAASMPTSDVAANVQWILTRAYDADLSRLEIRTEWIADVPCPPRNGASQNLAGVVNDAASMQATAVNACSYVPDQNLDVREVADAADPLIRIDASRVVDEIERLRVNAAHSVFVVFDVGIAYLQCMPQTSPPEIYCEAQSAEDAPRLAAALTPERVARLHAAGFADPGRAPNYWKTYPLDTFDDEAIADEILTILQDVYGYNGAMPLAVSTD